MRIIKQIKTKKDNETDSDKNKEDDENKDLCVKGENDKFLTCKNIECGSCNYRYEL